MVCGMLWYVVVKVDGGETLCLIQIQVIDYCLFSRRQIVLPHILPQIKIRVTEGVSLSDLDFVEGVGRRTRTLARGSRTLGDELMEISGSDKKHFIIV